MHMLRVLAGLAVLVGLVAVAPAVTTPNSSVTPQTPKFFAVQFLNTDTADTTTKDIVTGAADGTKCVALFANTNDNANHIVTIQVLDTSASVTGIIASGTVTASGSANNAGTGVDFFEPTVWRGLPYDKDSNRFVFLENGDKLQAKFSTSISTSGETITIIAICGNF